MRLKVTTTDNQSKRRKWLFVIIIIVISIVIFLAIFPPIPPSGTPGLSIITSTLTPEKLGFSYLQPLEATGGAPPYTWTIASGDLPPGLELIHVRPTDVSGNPIGQPFGLIDGRTKQAGTYSFTLEVTDSVGVSASKIFTIVVNYPSTNRICSDGSTPTSACPPTHTIIIESGNTQTGLINYSLPQPLKIKVDPPESGIGIAWKIIQGNGKFRSWTTTTDSNGIAQAEYILGKSQGENKIVASIMEGDVADSTVLPPSVTFTVEGKLPTIEKQNDQQSTPAFSAFANPLIILIKDPNNIPIEGVKVRFLGYPQGPNNPGLFVIPGEFTAPVTATFTNQSGIAKAVVGDKCDGPYNVKVELPEFEMSDQFSVTCTPPGLVRIVGSIVAALIPGEQVSITVHVAQSDPNPPPPCQSVPVTFAIVQGDGTLSTNTVNTSPSTCEASVTYTFGTDAEPDIISASAIGKTVYTAFNSPNIEIQSVDFLNSINIRKNKDIDVLDSPEWKKTFQPDDRNEPAAYKLDSVVKIKVRMLADNEISSADVDAVVTDGDALQQVIKKNVSFQSGIPVEVEFDVNSMTANVISKKDVKWQWKVSNMNGMGSQPKNSAASGAHTIYTLLNTAPQAPMLEPWAEVLDHSTSPSWAGGTSNAETAAANIVKKVFYSVGLIYDTATGESFAGAPPLFHLTGFLAHLNDGGIKICNCYDAAHIVVTFANAIGVDMKARFLDGGTGPIPLSGGGILTDLTGDPFIIPRNLNQFDNIIDPIGKEAQITNNPFKSPIPEPFIHDDTRTGGFDNHMYAMIGTKVFDANLMVDIERVPDGVAAEFPVAGPFSFELPTGIEEVTYWDRLLDDLPVRTLSVHIDLNEDTVPDDLDGDTVPDTFNPYGPPTAVDRPFTID